MPNFINEFLLSNTRLKTKTRYRIQSSFFIIITLYLSFAIYIFNSALPENPTQMVISILFVFTIVVLQFVTTYDPLYSGDPKKNDYIKCFHKNLPSHFIAKELEMPTEIAKLFWYHEIFNKWRDEKHEMHFNYITSLQRGFDCRMAYTIIIFFWWMFIVSAFLNTIIGIAIFANLKFNVEFLDNYFKHCNFFHEVLFMVASFIVFWFARHYNKSINGKCRGAFEKFDEINQLNNLWIKKNLHDLKPLVRFYYEK